MNLLESIRLALASISINKLRSFLTMLGIIIGISAVITITTIGNSLKQTIASTMNELGGSNLLYGYVDAVYPESDEDWDTFVYPDMEEEDYITDDMIKRYKEAFPDEIKAVIVQNYLSAGSFKEGKRYANLEMMGTSSGYIDSLGLDIVRGRDLTDKDYEQKRHSAIVSDLFVKYACKEDEDPIGKEITVSTEDGAGYNFVIVGVYHYDSRIFENMGSDAAKVSERDKSTYLFIPASTANQLSDNPTVGYESLQILSTDTADPTLLSQKTNAFFADLYADNEDFQFTCQDMASQLKTINTVLDILTVAISIIAAISLIVGGVGVMNIMLVSIMERTKEIGIRKALGAKNSNIRMQFLTEAVIICLIGGVIGIVIGITNGFLLGFAAKTIGQSMAADYMSLLTITIRPSITAILIAVIFSMLTGIVFGSYPAGRAAKMSPIDALRYE